jgi:hypothetical protein
VVRDLCLVLLGHGQAIMDVSSGTFERGPRFFLYFFQIKNKTKRLACLMVRKFA